MSSQSGALGWIRLFVGNQRQFELPARLDHGLRARRIALAGKLHQNFVVAAAGKGNRRLSQTKAVDAARDGFKRLVHRLRAKVGDYRGLQRKQVAVVFSRRRRSGPVGELAVDQVAKIRGSCGVDIANQNVRVVHAADLAKTDVLVVKLPVSRSMV